MRTWCEVPFSQLRAIRRCYGTCWVCLILRSSSYYSACAGVVHSFVSSTPRSSCMRYVTRASCDAPATCVPPFSCHMQICVIVRHVIVSFLLVAVPLLFLILYLRAWLAQDHHEQHGCAGGHTHKHAGTSCVVWSCQTNERHQHMLNNNY